MNAIIHCRNRLLKLSFGNIFMVGKQVSEVDQVEKVDFIESIIQEHVDRGFMEDPIERALIRNESNDHLKSKCMRLENLFSEREKSNSNMHAGH